jgi:single-strand DNA-binding protein
MAFVVITGEIGRVYDGQVVGNNFEKRDFIVDEIRDRYPNTWQIQAQQGGCNVLDNFKPGDKVIVTCDVQGRKWVKDGKEMYFTTLVMTRIQPLDEFTKPAPRQSTSSSGQGAQAMNKPQETPVQENPETDDLPF